MIASVILALDFAAVLMPELEEIGMDANPEIYPTHTFVSA